MRRNTNSMHPPENDLAYFSFQLINQVANNYKKHTVVPVFRAAKYLFELAAVLRES